VGEKVLSNTKKERKTFEVLHDYMMQHPTYAYPSSIPNPL
jgi:hypothetical protein